MLPVELNIEEDINEEELKKLRTAFEKKESNWN